jgi:hypothetical protein
MDGTIRPFAVKDCALIALATGRRAQNPRELRNHLAEVSENSITYHFWGGLLRPRFDNPEYHNDFAIWTAHSLHNKLLAERLAIINPLGFESIEQLRDELLETLDDYLDNTDFPEWARSDDQFDFVRSQLVVFDTGLRVEHPRELGGVLPEMSLGSIFYHFIEGRRRNAGARDDFCTWFLECWPNHTELIQRVERVRPGFTPLKMLREELSEVLAGYFNVASS